MFFEKKKNRFTAPLTDTGKMVVHLPTRSKTRGKLVRQASRQYMEKRSKKKTVAGLKQGFVYQLLYSQRRSEIAGNKQQTNATKQTNKQTSSIILYHML